MFKVQADGRLAAMGDILTNKAPRKFAIHPFGTYAYFHDRHKDNRILSYIIKYDGKLEAKKETPLAGKTDGAINIHPSGKLLFVSEWYKGTVSVYSINSEGEIKLKTELKNTPNISAIDFSPNGKFVYLISKYTNKLLTYKTNEKGEYVFLSEFATGLKPVDLKVHPTGKVIYISNSGSNDISVFTVNNEGSVTEKPKIKTGNNPLSLSIGRLKKIN
jgi:6-phosphogluconolactonase (cycloisomerase 2 family)